MPIAKLLRAIWSDQEGITSIEYALMLALLFLASVGAWGTLGGTKMRMTLNAVTTYVSAGS